MAGVNLQLTPAYRKYKENMWSKDIDTTQIYSYKDYWRSEVGTNILVNTKFYSFTFFKNIWQ